MSDASLCPHQYRRDVETCPWCDLAEAAQQLAAAQERIKRHTAIAAHKTHALCGLLQKLTAAQERIAVLEHRQDHYRAALELVASWLAIAPQASLEWVESLGDEILAALDEQAADPLPCEERIAALEAENESLKEHGRRYFDLFEQFKTESARLRRMILDIRGCLECGCWENEIQALKEEPAGDSL